MQNLHKHDARAEDFGIKRKRMNEALSTTLKNHSMFS